MRDSYTSQIDSHNAINALAGMNCLISFGANVPSAWGKPPATLCNSLSILEQNQVYIIARSLIYRTQPHFGAGLMSEFYNAVVAAHTNLPIGSLLRLFKSIERKAGRRVRPRPCKGGRVALCAGWVCCGRTAVAQREGRGGRPRVWPDSACSTRSASCNPAP